MDSHSIIDQLEGGFPRNPEKGDQIYRYTHPDLTFEPFQIYRYGGKARGWSVLQRQPGFKKNFTVSEWVLLHEWNSAAWCGVEKEN